MIMFRSALVLLLVATATTTTMGFSINTAAGSTNSATTTASRMTVSSALYAKGFGSPEEKKVKSEGQVKREQQSSKYDEIAARGGQEYNIYVRQFGSDDQSWLPCGSIAVPRAAQVSNAIFANTAGLVSAITRTYPKLKGFETEFEYGFNLKIYPDDPVEVARNDNAPKPGISIGNWISNLLSPIDASKIPPPPIED